MYRSGFTTSTSAGAWTSEACTSAGPLTSSISVTGSSVKLFRQSCLRLRMISVTSSLTCATEVNSCATPSIWMDVTAAPHSELSSTRRSVLPSVVPNPGSRGSISNLPYWSSPSIFRTWGFTASLVSIANATSWVLLHHSSAGVELDDEVLFDTLLHLVSLRQCEHLARLLLLVERQPGRNGAYSGRLEREGDDGAVPMPHPDLVAGLQLVGGDVDDPAVHVEVSVGDELTGLPPRGGEPQPVDDIVETQLEVAEEVEAGDPALSHRRVEVVAELPLEQAVRAPRLLLRAELQPVVRGLSPACLAVHARRHGAALDGA